MAWNSLLLDGHPTGTHDGPRPPESLFSAGMKARGRHSVGLGHCLDRTGPCPFESVSTHRPGHTSSTWTQRDFIRLSC